MEHLNEERKLLVLFLGLLASIWPTILFTIALSDNVTFELRGSQEMQDFVMILFVFVLLASLGAWLVLLRWFILPRVHEALFVVKEDDLASFFLKETQTNQSLSDAVSAPLNEEHKSLPFFWLLLAIIWPLTLLPILFFEYYEVPVKGWVELSGFLLVLFVLALLASFISWLVLLGSYIATKVKQASSNFVSGLGELESQEMLSSEENEDTESEYSEEDAGR